MKKNYEKNEFIIIFSFLFIIISIITVLDIFNTKYRKYKIIDSFVISEHYLEVIVMEEDYKLLIGSKYLFIDNKRYKKDIVSVERNVIKRNNQNYHEVIMRVDFSYRKYKDNDNVRITIYDNKEKVINIFKSCWKED